MIKRIKIILFVLCSTIGFSQVDYSDRWEDFYSYTNAKDFVIENSNIYTIVDNAVFIYNTDSEEVKKISSVNGLSGETCSAISYSSETNRLIIGYENGLLEVVDEDQTITIATDIIQFNLAGDKSINHIYKYQNKLYLSTPFAVVEYDVEKLEFGDTFFIGNNSSSVYINQITVVASLIYAATNDGIYFADLNEPNLVDYNKWTKISSGDFKSIVTVNSKIYTCKNNELFSIQNNAVVSEKTLTSDILDLKNSQSNLIVSLLHSAIVYSNDLEVQNEIVSNQTHSFSLNTALSVNDNLYLATKQYGILKYSYANQQFGEIHPEGPLSNQVFSLSVYNNHLWVVYGGYNDAYVPRGIRGSYSHFNAESWNNVVFDSQMLFYDFVHVTIDKNHPNRVFISSYSQTSEGNYYSGGGLLEIENDLLVNFYSSENSLLENFFSSNIMITTRVNGTVFDSDGNLWITDSLGKDKLKKLETDGTWKSFDLSSLQTNPTQEVNELQIDGNNSLWMGTRRNGVYVFNGRTGQKKVLNTNPNTGNLPQANVRTVAIDRNNYAWLGTQTGLVVYTDSSGIFQSENYQAEPVVIIDDGTPRRLLGDQTINSIVVDGADNKWFGTDNGGVLYTNPNGQKTLANFNKDNSPLPSNKILKIGVDIVTGKVYFATDKGIVAYNSKVAAFGNHLGAVYAYPNPALSNHDEITIDGRAGAHLPKGTNVKILDVAGNLVYESNVVEGQELQGGKVVWNKRNLAGKKVASGVYIVLLINEEGTETSTTKIAIIN